MPPNILFIFTDQQRADTLGIANPVMRTPVLNRLCAEGTRFTQAYTPAPVCVAARCSLIYGQYPLRTGCFENGFAMPADTRQRPTFMSALSSAGYNTHGVGKMHFSPDSQALMGFTHRDRSEEMGDPEFDDYTAWLREIGYGHVCEPKGARGEMYYIPQPAPLPAHAHNSAWVAEKSIRYLQSRDRSKPFMLWSSFIDPHPPFSPPFPWNKLYRGPSMPLPKRPPQMQNFWTYINRVQNRYKYRDQGIDDNLLRVIKAYYYASISFIDYQVGRILSELEAQGELDNTLVLWSSDHGEFLGDYDCFGKRSFLNSAAAIPLVMRLPGRFPSGLAVDSPASLVDIYPTFLATAECPFVSEIDGLDLAGLSKSPESRNIIFGDYQSGGPGDANQAIYMAATNRWKYIYSASEHREFLFDLKIDPDETRNRSQTIGYERPLQDMRGKVISRLLDHAYTQNLENRSWRRLPPPAFPVDPDGGYIFQDPTWARNDMVLPGYSVEDF
jgi:arylsulfatase